ncbi:hypothetical protein SPRG_14483 [Saprolegnia parasitica CBS 223.65]|uniref:PH domain-containing protein n=1 Tax=Saprolegnia parasitica (strain CBS 223.65) TaxID=695850 RepID=A0A067C0B4_SAPPC|nr:hypothetical protein SPRG_14483 [Saprolegnia parasitica CBS 223.65]KDO20237.1 hypothetical protein SPRG_14483 [Saprolegnia parasitica CBS 223.65]|eukprot:XP_012209050.1 hypothetical protein SPRG_14483 [Saprolegnia parasitica CBS 223.65]
MVAESSPLSAGAFLHTPQPHHDILFFGTLDKRRDGAVRGGWATRLFLLTSQWLVYFRLTSKLEILGEERERVDLKSIAKVRVAPESEVPSAAVEVAKEFVYLEITLQSHRVLLMRASRNEAAAVDTWVAAINEQREVLLQPTPKLMYSGTAKAPTPAPVPVPPETTPSDRFDHAIALVGMVDDYTEREEFVVAKHVAFGQRIELGVVKQGGACLLMLDDGGVARIGTQALLGSWDANETCWVEFVGASVPCEVEVSVSCQVVKHTPPITRASSDAALLLPSPSHTFLRKASDGASLGFLLLAILVHFMYGVQGFHWSHKACLTAGAALAITSLLHSSDTTSATRLKRAARRTQASLIPKVQLTLIVHQCRRTAAAS